MSRSRSVVLSLVLLATSALPAAAASPSPAATTGAPARAKQAATPAARFVPGRVIVRWKDPVVGPAREKAHGLARLVTLPGPGAPGLLGTKGKGVGKTVAELRADPAVAWAQPDYIVSAEGGR